MKVIRGSLCILLCGSVLACSPSNQQEKKNQQLKNQELKIYNWTDYVDPETVKEFEKKYQIKINYSYYDADETLEAKVLTGKSGYDLVGPSNVFLGRQIQAGAYQKLDKSLIPNYKNINPELLKLLSTVDPNNDYAIPYFWGSNTMAINEDKVKAIIGDTLPHNLWDLAFNPKYTQKLKKCGVTYMDSPTEMYPLALNYLGFSPETTDMAEIQQATDLFKRNRSNLKRFVSSGVVDGLARGDICVAVGFSSDLNLAKERAQESVGRDDIKVFSPKEGFGIWIDTFTIPKDAVNVKNAHLYINYTLDAQVAARNGMYASIAPGSLPAKYLMDETYQNNTAIFPDEESLRNGFILQPINSHVLRVITREWQNIKT